MKCERVKDLIQEYIDGEMQPVDNNNVKDHLRKCPKCQDYAKSIQTAWNLLGEVKEIEPDPGYISRFWTELSLRTPWYEKVFKSCKNALKKPKLAPVYATVLVVLIIGVFSIRNYIQIEKSASFLAGLSESDIEMVENMELVENLDVIDDLDFLQDLEIIENFDVISSQET